MSARRTTLTAHLVGSGPANLSRGDTIALATRDWAERRAYVDEQGNYRLKNEHGARGGVAPWNRIAKSFFVSCSALHDWTHRLPEERGWWNQIGTHPRPTARRAARAARLLWRWGRYIDPRSAVDLVLRTIARDKTLLPWRGSR
jgi:hypothetical protein